MDPEYPGKELLAEISRVIIAGSRLDLWMGFLWHHLDPTMVDVVRARPDFDQLVRLFAIMDAVEDGANVGW
jgi:hypothetical protein